MKKSSIYKSTVATKKVEFKDEDGKVIADEFLQITYAKIKRPYSEIKAFFKLMKASQTLVKIQADIKKRLAVKTQELEGADSDERKAGIEAQIKKLNVEAARVNEEVEDSIAPFSDYLIPSDDSPRKVLLDWDLLDDNDVKIPATKQELEDLPAETIIFIASELMGADEVGESEAREIARVIDGMKPEGSGYVSPLIGRTIPDWYGEFDIAKEIGIPKTELDDCDSVTVSQAIARIQIKNSVESGHFRPKKTEED